MRASATDGHPSLRPTRELSEPPAAAEAALRSPIRSCSGQKLAAFHSSGEPEASSLWRWSSPHGGRALPADLLYGARTFLGRGLSTDAPAAVQPPPGTTIVPDSGPVSNARSGSLCTLPMWQADLHAKPDSGAIPVMQRATMNVGREVLV